jgi:hypothetical protein
VLHVTGYLITLECLEIFNFLIEGQNRQVLYNSNVIYTVKLVFSSV